LNKKILSFIFGSLLVFSLFGAIEFQEVSAATTMSVTVTTQANNYTYPHFSSTSMPMRLRFTFTPTGVSSTDVWDEVTIQAPANYVLASKESQPTPSGFTKDPSSSADGSNGGQSMVYTCNITTNTARTIDVDIVSPAPTPPNTWTVTTGFSVSGNIISNPATVILDDLPKFNVTYTKTPKIPADEAGPDPAVLGTGTVTINVQSDQILIEKPTITIKQVGLALSTKSGSSVTGSVPGTVFTTTYSITSSNGLNDGLALVTVSGKNQAALTGTEINDVVSTAPPYSDGSDFYVDSVCNKPSLTTPSNGASEPDGDVDFAWTAVDDITTPPVNYTLQCSTSSSFSSNVITRSTTSTTDTITGLTPGTWYWRVAATDGLGNFSGYPTTPRSFTINISSAVPTFRIRYLKTPKIDYNTTPDVVGAGSMQIRIYSSEVLKTKPTVQVKLHNQTTWTTLSVSESAPASVFTATYNVPTATTNNGLAQITISGTSMSGNIGTAINPPAWDPLRVAPNLEPLESDSDGAFFYVSTTTDSPALNFPNNGYSVPGHGNIVVFTFNKITDLTSERPADPGQNNCITYNIQYSTNPDFTSNAITQSVDVEEAVSPIEFCGVGGTVYYNWEIIDATLRSHTSQALSNGTWFWRVWATDKLGNQSPYSETRQFSVSTVRPGLVSPTDLSLLNYNNPKLIWGVVPGAAAYNIRLSRGDNVFINYTSYPDKIAVNGFTGGTTYDVSLSEPPSPPIGILEDGVWYWAVSSSLDSQAYSGTWRFTVDTTGPPATNLLTLDDGQVSQNKRPTFTWTAVSDTNDLSNPVRYYVEISGDSTFPDSDTPVLAMPTSFTGVGGWEEVTYRRGPLTTTSFVPTSDFVDTDSDQAYYWRVYAVDSAGNKGTNSLTRNFRVSTSPLLPWADLGLVLRSPSNGFTLNTSNPSLEWRHTSESAIYEKVSSYVIQYSTDITFPADKTTNIPGVFQVLGINVDIPDSINMGYTIQTPLFNGTYFWRVCAVDIAGNRTQFTAPWSFTVNVPDNEQPPTPQCSTTIPCPSGQTCQSGVCVPIVMSPGNLTITVQNAGGTAIAGATVTVDGTAQTTDAAGQVTFTALTGGSHTINNITASGYTDYGTSTVSINGNTTQTITLTVPGTEGYIWGTVYFDAIGTAAPNVLIDIYNQSTDVKVDSRLTNSEGKFQSSPLPSTGTYYAKIPAYEKELRDLQPTSLTTGEKIVILETKGTVTGIVQDDTGQIVSSATVVLKKYPGEEFVDTKTTNSIGQFSFDALPGTYVVTISKAGYDAYTSSSFSVQSKQTVNLQSVLGNIVLNSIRGTLAVSVKDDKGATINTATVTIRSSTGAVVRSITTSGGTGSTQLAPGAYRVSAVSSGYAESLQQSTNITSNQTSSVSITLAPATGSIRVVAKDASGAPLAGASVYVDGSLSGITDSEGELLVTGLKLGTHTVRITKGGFTAVEEQVTSGDSTVIVDTALRKNNLPLYLGIGLGLLILAGAIYYFKFGKQGPKRPMMPKGPALPGRPGAPKLRPHRHKGGLPPSSIRVKKKNL